MAPGSPRSPPPPPGSSCPGSPRPRAFSTSVAATGPPLVCSAMRATRSAASTPRPRSSSSLVSARPRPVSASGRSSTHRCRRTATRCWRSARCSVTWARSAAPTWIACSRGSHGRCGPMACCSSTWPTRAGRGRGPAGPGPRATAGPCSSRPRSPAICSSAASSPTVALAAARFAARRRPIACASTDRPTSSRR
jgi:hypothetical protein